MQPSSAIMQSIEWDIFRYVIAVADNGSAVAAAKVLGVDGTTVIRHISRFEKQRGIQLFERLPSGYSPTAECEAILKLARDLQEGVTEINRRITGHDLRLEGTISVTTTDSFLEAVVADIIAEFCSLHPQIQIETMVTTNRVSLSRQDAHVAIRAAQEPQDHLVGQRIAEVAFAVYGAAKVVDQLAGHRDIATLGNLPWIGMRDALSRSLAWQWMSTHIPSDAVKVTSDTFVAMRALARGGAGLVVLPCCLGDPDPEMVRVIEPIKETATTLWVLTHPDVRKAARVRAFSSFAGRQLRNQQALLEGMLV
ncbi:MAG: LysR family transcriptional regulator [Rhizobiaceae bacterium]